MAKRTQNRKDFDLDIRLYDKAHELTVTIEVAYRENGGNNKGLLRMFARVYRLIALFESPSLIIKGIGELRRQVFDLLKPP